MADISRFLQDILDAVYGEQVRGSIHDAIKLINDVAEVVLTTGIDVTGPTSSSEGFFEDSLYLNTDTFELWKCVGTDAWQSQGNLKGDTGNGIDNITKTSTAGLVDTYTITYTDGATDTFMVTNGANGNKWYRGTAIAGKAILPTVYPTGIAEAHENDFYLNPTEGAIYHCVTGGADTVATWAYDFTMSGGGGSVSSLNDLSDVDIDSATLAEGQILAFNDISGEFENVDLNIEKVADVNIDPLTLVDGQVLKYNAADDEWQNKNESGGMLPYLYIDSEAGATVTVVQPDSTVITPTAAGSGHWECELTGGYGTYVIHSVLSGQGDTTQSLSVDTVKEYHVTDTHYDHTVSFVAPSGSTVRIEGGTEIYTLTGTGSTQTQVVHSASTSFTVTATMDGNGKPYTFTTPSTTGQTTTIPSGTFDFGTINVSVAADFVTAGSTITCVNGGTSCTPKTAASTLVFRVPTTGTWTISGSVGGQTYSKDVTVTALDTPVSVALQTTVTVTVTLHGAVGAVITYTDANGAQTQTLGADGTKANVSIAIPENPSIVFTDTTVAKDPDNLSNNYTKSVTIAESTTDVYVMPDNALYWWGYNPDMMEQGSTANGWHSNYAGTNPPTFNTNDAVIGTASIAWGTKNPITGNIKALVIGIVDSGGGAPNYGYVCATPNKGQYAPNGFTELLKSAGYDSLKLININNVSNSYYIHWGASRSHSIKAIWYE